MKSVRWNVSVRVFVVKLALKTAHFFRISLYPSLFTTVYLLRALSIRAYYLYIVYNRDINKSLQESYHTDFGALEKRFRNREMKKNKAG